MIVYLTMLTMGAFGALHQQICLYTILSEAQTYLLEWPSIAQIEQSTCFRAA